MSDTPDYAAWLSRLQKHLQRRFSRAVIRVSGDKKWCIETVQSLLDASTQSLWVSDSIPQALSPKQARTQLGREYQTIVFDCWDAFDLDALGAVIGTLRGGGILFLLTPPLQDWPLLKQSLYLQMIKPLFLQHPALFYLQQGQPPGNQAFSSAQAEKVTAVPAPYITTDQQHTVETITDNFLQDKSKAMVLIADRGRGKSSSLGLAAGQLLNKGIHNIRVTAPRLRICQPLFFHAEKRLHNSQQHHGYLESSHGKIQFQAPDALLNELPAADLLIVDEAAAIPLPLLKQMLLHYPSIIFASTLYGYEGTGRGFILNFFRLLDQVAEGWKKITMQTPVRWAENDPLESWANDLLCLHAELESAPDINGIPVTDFNIRLLDKNKLIENTPQRNALFSLLVSAHYRTRPSDFQFLLDNDSVRIYTLMHQHRILAAVVINQEGSFDRQLASAIYKGERRPAGNLLAQTLCFHAGIEEAACLSYSRIMRIAVHPELQSQGLGSHLMKTVIQQEKKFSQMIGSSFAASEALINFWKQLGFEIVRMGFSRDHVSASHSAVVLQTLSEKQRPVFEKLRLKFQHNIQYWLEDSLKDIQNDLKSILMDDAIQPDTQITTEDWQDINSFAYYSRGYEACSPALHKLITQYAQQLKQLDQAHQQLINTRIINKFGWDETVKQCGLTGKNQALKNLRVAIKCLLDVAS